MYNHVHRYDEDVKEFFQTIRYLGGHKTYSMLRGPMLYGQRGGDVSEMRMNLGGPDEETLRKNRLHSRQNLVLSSISVL